MCPCWVILQDFLFANRKMHRYVIYWQQEQLASTHSHTIIHLQPSFPKCVWCQSAKAATPRRAPHHNSGTLWIPKLPMEHSMHQWSWHPMDGLWGVCKWYSLEANMLHYHTSHTSYHTNMHKWIGAHTCKQAHTDTRIQVIEQILWLGSDKNISSCEHSRK